MRIADIIHENCERRAELNGAFDPLTGQGSTGRRVEFVCKGFMMERQWLPEAMMREPMVRKMAKAGTLLKFFKGTLHKYSLEPQLVELVSDMFIRLRCKYDFAFWAYSFVRIHDKATGAEIPLRLNHAQRKLVNRLEAMREADRPIRLVLLKARQWGGSTCVQMYMAWIQLVLAKGRNSLIVGHQGQSTAEVKGMYDTMMAAYPTQLLHAQGEAWDESEAKMVGVGVTQSISRVPQRDCKIKLGTAVNPDSARGGDSALVHCTEVAFWKKTEGKTPEAIVRAACSGTLLAPLTLIVYESTANGTGNFFQMEYQSAKDGTSGFDALFVPWYDIELYQKPFAAAKDRFCFIDWLMKHKDVTTSDDARHDAPAFLWGLWQKGATIEGINWYIDKRAEFNDHSDFAAEYPSDDVEAFAHSGARVFDIYKVAALAEQCKAPKWRGELVGESDSGARSLAELRFVEQEHGELWVWQKPEIFVDGPIADRYLVVVDVGGRGEKADFSIICVIDRYWMMEGGKPEVVAEWRGHTDIDLLAWNAARVAKWYDNALLVIESNTIETREPQHVTEGDQTGFILNEIKEAYPNLYARRQSDEEIREGAPRKWGFHTNVSTKPMIISALVRAVRDGLYVERDKRATDELVVYERRQNGSYGAIPGMHDDLLMTRAIGLWVCFYEMDVPRVKRMTSGQARARQMIGEASF